MAILPVVQMGNPVLHSKAKKVKTIDGSIQKLIDDMIETMRDIDGVGLAAPQVGVPLQVVVYELPDDKKVTVLINPEIVKSSEETEMMDEGCLSLPGYRGEVKRLTSVTVKGRNRQGKMIRIKGEGLLAQVLQHEVDHINGIVFVDNLESPDKLYKTEDEEEGASSI
ncbi:MAG TPA: peptide deformylase [Dehalococcoidia bacterium]|nr:peptide deformylase [Dehalococcoidia bacterium]